MKSTISTSSGPPTPTYIFRYHEQPVHALHFFANNVFLASGDSGGVLIIWRLSTRRPLTVFQAHEAGIMAIKDWGLNRLITHGRDHKMRVWQVNPQYLEISTPRLSGRIDTTAASQASTATTQDLNQAQKPWLLHSMSVNALNFCAFATCNVPGSEAKRDCSSTTSSEDSRPDLKEGLADIGSTASTQTDPSALEELLIAAPNGLDSSGIDIFHLPSEKRISQVKSKPNDNMGMVMALGLQLNNTDGKMILVAGYEDGSARTFVADSRKDLAGLATVTNSGTTFLWNCTAKYQVHTQPVLSLDNSPNGKSFFTSSADATIACYDIVIKGEDSQDDKGTSKAEPQKLRNTKHAGQQDLKVRSDGKILATAGWDGNVRVYSAKTLKELAVLQWHQDGCYSTAFAEILEQDNHTSHQNRSKTDREQQKSLVEMNAMEKMKMERDKNVHNTHWLVAGSKDGKISMWDVY